MHNDLLTMPYIIFLTSFHQNDKKPAFYLPNTQLDIPHHVSAQPIFFNENIFQRKGSHIVTQNKYAKLIVYFKILADTIPFSVMERAYFAGKQAVHLPGARKTCKPSRVSLRGEKDPSVSGPHFSQCTNNTSRSSLESSELLYCITHTAALLRREVRQGRTSITEHLLSRGKSCNTRVL